MRKTAMIYVLAAVAATLAWLWVVEGVRPDRWDLVGGTVCVLGAAIILFGPRRA